VGGSKGVASEGRVCCTEISGAGNGSPGGGVGNRKVPGAGSGKDPDAGVSTGFSGVAVGTVIRVGGRIGGRLGGWSWLKAVVAEDIRQPG